jgi:hypothetical protein
MLIMISYVASGEQLFFHGRTSLTYPIMSHIGSKPTWSNPGFYRVFYI